MTSSETIEVIARRYACRAYQDTPVPTEILQAVAEAGVRAPSAVNRQPWRLVVITDKSVLDQIGRVGLENLKSKDAAAYDRIIGRGGVLLYNAPAMIIVATEPPTGPFPVSLDAGIVASHLVLAATSLGVDSCVVALPGMAFTGDDGAELRQTCLPEGYDFGIAVLLGYAAAPGGQPHQPDLAKISYI